MNANQSEESQGQQNAVSQGRDDSLPLCIIISLETVEI